MFYDQSEYDLRCEWGEQGVTRLAPISDVVAIVDVLSFSTSVEIATNRGAIVFPYRTKDRSALYYAKSVKAELASRKRQAKGGYSLSPASLIDISVATRLVLPSPNGATLSLSTGQTLTLAGCLRNCQAIAQFAQSHGSKIALIPAGERWEDESLRPALEDLIGVGAIFQCLEGRRSPEAEAAAVIFDRFKDELATVLRSCSSGKELIANGFAKDIELAAALNSSNCVPVLKNNAYVKAE